MYFLPKTTLGLSVNASVNIYPCPETDRQDSMFDTPHRLSENANGRTILVTVLRHTIRLQTQDVQLEAKCESSHKATSEATMR